MFSRELDWLESIEEAYAGEGAPSDFAAQLLHGRSRLNKEAQLLRRRGYEIRDRLLGSLNDSIGETPRPSGIGWDEEEVRTGRVTDSEDGRRAALATLDMIEEHDLLGRARTIGETGIRLMEQWKAKDPRIGEVRGKGAMMALELVDPDSQKPDAALTAAVAQAARSRGLILLTCGTYGNVIRLLPPVTMPDELFAEGMEILEQALRDQP